MAKFEFPLQLDDLSCGRHGPIVIYKVGDMTVARYFYETKRHKEWRRIGREWNARTDEEKESYRKFTHFCGLKRKNPYMVFFLERIGKVKLPVIISPSS